MTRTSGFFAAQSAYIAFVLSVGLTPHALGGPSNASIDLFPARQYETGGGPKSVGVGDLDGDQDLDAVVADSSVDSVAFMRNRGDGTFQRVANLPAGNGPRAVALGDLDGDLHLDIVVANRLANTISVIRNLGSGTFAPAVHYSVGVEPVALALADIDGDHDPDIAVVNQGSSSVTILRNTGNATLTIAATHTNLAGPGSLASGKIDADADIDLVISVYGGYEVLVNDGLGTFVPGPYVQLQYGTWNRIALGDLDANGSADLVAADQSDGGLVVLLGNGNGTFTQSFQTELVVSPWEVAIADLDGDTRPDIVVVGEGDVPLNVVRNLGSGAFAGATQYHIGAQPNGVAVGDLDDDGNLDLILTDLGAQPSNSDEAAWKGGINVVRNRGGGALVAPVVQRLDVLTPSDVLTGDVDGDGDPDAVLISPYDADLGIGAAAVCLNTEGTLGAAVTYIAGGSAAKGQLGDLDGDGDLDLAIANSAYRLMQSPNYFNDRVALLFNDGHGAFGSPVYYQWGRSPESVALGDIDGDQDLDVVVVSRGRISPSVPPALFVAKNQGNGVLDAPIEYPCASGPLDVRLADLDGDDDLDVAVASMDELIVQVRRNAGDGTFGAAEPVASGGGAFALSIGDLDGINGPDLVVTNESQNAVAVILNLGGGVFDEPVPTTGWRLPTDATLGDFDGDGDLDIAAANSSGETVGVVFNNGNGTFTGRRSFSLPESPLAIAADDLDGDTDVDLVVTRFTGGVGVLSNQRLRRTPNVCPADVDGDGYVNAGDFSVLAASFGTTVEPVGAHGDLNRDGVVNVSDFLIFAAGFGCEP